MNRKLQTLLKIALLFAVLVLIAKVDWLYQLSQNLSFFDFPILLDHPWVFLDLYYGIAVPLMTLLLTFFLYISLLDFKWTRGQRRLDALVMALVFYALYYLSLFPLLHTSFTPLRLLGHLLLNGTSTTEPLFLMMIIGHFFLLRAFIQQRSASPAEKS